MATPAPRVAAGTCSRHRRKPAVTSCSVCGARVCVDCLVPTPVGMKCARCTGTPPGGARPSRRLVALAAAGAVLAGASVYALATGGGGSPPPPEAEDRAGPGGGVRELAVQFPSAGRVRLAGSLVLPEGATRARPVPGVVIVPGFGPTTRDGVSRSGAAPDTLYRDLSQVLARAGIASVRYDKRGAGQSVLPADGQLRFEDMQADTAAAVAFLAERAEIDGERIALAGHDEGGLLAMRTAGRGGQVKAVVLLAVPGRPLVDVLGDDLLRTTPDPARARALVEQLRAGVDEVTREGRLPDPERLDPVLRPVFPAGQVDYVRSIFTVDPPADAAGVNVPVLIVRGGTDPGVSAVDTERLAAALAGRGEVLVAPDAGHTLAVDSPPSPPRAGQSSDSMHQQEFHGAVGGVQRDEEALRRIAQWLQRHLRAGA